MCARVGDSREVKLGLLVTTTPAANTAGCSWKRRNSIPPPALSGSDEELGEHGIVLDDLEGEAAEFVLGRFRTSIAGRAGGDGETGLARWDVDGVGVHVAWVEVRCVR